MASVVYRLLVQKNLRTKADRFINPRLPTAPKLRPSLARLPRRWKIPKGVRRQAESVFRDLFGPSPRGTTWAQLAERYPERFRDYLDQAQEEADEDEGEF